MDKRKQDQLLNDWLQRHQGLLLKVTRSFANLSHDRDDLLQEIVLQLWKSIPRYTAQVVESTWIYKVSLYTAMNWMRKESRRSHIQHGSPPDVASETTVSDARVDWLYARIAELAPIDRSLALLMLDGFSYREIAQTLGISESNVGVRLNRIRKQLAARHESEKRNEL